MEVLRPILFGVLGGAIIGIYLCVIEVRHDVHAIQSTCTWVKQ